MAKRNSGSGLVYRKVDLHIHTPASHDYGDKDVTPEAIVEKALSEDLAQLCQLATTKSVLSDV
jgi:hypothetical protein